MRNDIRYAVRTLWRDRAFAAMVVLSLAVGIGANTAIFSMVNGVLLRKPDLKDPDRLVSITVSSPQLLKQYSDLPINLGMLMEWRRQLKSFEGIAALQPGSMTLTGIGEPERIPGAQVSANLFKVLGVDPRLGRHFQEEEDYSGRDRVVILTDSLWRRRFHANPSVVGSKVMFSSVPYEIVGVLPPSFHMPRQLKLGASRVDESTEIFRPLGYENERLALRFSDLNFWAIGRLRQGVTMAQASGELNAVMQSISQRIGGPFQVNARLVSLQERAVGDVRQGLVLVMAAVGAVLMVLWVNLANLSLVRATGRARDSAIRAALGAGRGRLVRESVVESTVLALTGGGLGIVIAYFGLQALKAAAPIDLPRLQEVTVDPQVLLFAVTTSLLTGIVLGIPPALRRAISAPFEMLKSGSRGSTEAKGGMRVRNALVSLEVGLSAALLVTAGLLLASFVRLMTIDRGFAVDRVIAADMNVPGAKYREDQQRTAFFDRVLEKARSMPGVQSASIISALPLQGETWIDTIRTEHDTRREDEVPHTNVRFVNPGYFQTLEIPLHAGRDFDDRDRGRNVTIISQSLAQKLWPGIDGIVGRKLIHNGTTCEVVGVTPDIRSTGLDEDPVNMLYIPQWQRPQYSVSLLVRTGMDPAGLGGAIRAAVWSIDGEIPVPKVRTMKEVMNQSVAQRRFQMMLVLLFAVAALALAAFGTYGVVSYAVARRRSEMGIRMALGAERSAIMRMVLRQGMTPVIVGLAAGTVAALVIGRYVASLLFRVSPRDPLAFSIAAGALLVVAAAACWIPARRATRVNPIEALRFE